MVKTLTRHGNSHSLIIDKPILDLLDIGEATLLKITTDGQSIIVSPVRDDADTRRLVAVKREMHRKYGRMMKKLAE